MFFYYYTDYDYRGGEKFSKFIEERIQYIKEIQLWPGLKTFIAMQDSKNSSQFHSQIFCFFTIVNLQ